ncbi:glycosyltransferase family 39 protein [Pseudanabaena sp. BC1403]|uniref:glycosyltransferase family 39 protein n=1 Tax=Pseudanabaena sp. BC1403 TaxID=2043171 RepID=UPI000CD890CB|nr:glycosyltransferase family 39 protein [Pseudanabaena sp. BC1403]
MKRFGNSLISLALVLTLGCLLGLLGFAIWDKAPTPLTSVSWSPTAQWITTPQPSYRLYARHTFNLTNKAQAAWLRLSADNSFILYVNGKQLGRQLATTNSSLSFAARNTLANQNINDSEHYDVRLENRFIGYHHHWKQTFYVDLSEVLSTGENVIALEVQKQRQDARVVVEGYIYPVKGANPLSITTGESQWKVSSLAENEQNISWFEPNFSDENWIEPKLAGAIKEKTFSRLSQNIFERVLEGSWITGTESKKEELWFNGIWDVPQSQGRSFIRFSGDGEYLLLLNGQMVSTYRSDDNKKLHLFEVTNLMHKGQNILSARLARSLNINSNDSPRIPLGFFLDGWRENMNGEVVDTIATNSSWQTSSTPRFDESSPRAIAFRLPDPQEFNRLFEGNAYLLNYPDFLLHSSFWQILGMGAAIVNALLIGRLGFNSSGMFNSLIAGAGVMLPGTLFLIGMGLLKHRYAESEMGILFAHPSVNVLILLIFISIQVITLLGGIWSNSQYSNANRNSFQISLWAKKFADSSLENWSWLFTKLQLSRWGQWIWLTMIVGIGFGLRAYDLAATARDSDENTSLDAIRGILNTGAPVATSGIWYTRGPLYHYSVALWLKIFGYSSENARFTSVIFGTITLVLVFFLARKFTGKIWLALLITAILAIDPWELAISRNTRFYQFLQMNVMLAFLFFAKGFIFKEGKIYQSLFFVSTMAFLLTQEGYLTLLPCFLIGFLCFYRPFSLKKDWSIVMSTAIVILIFGFNLIFFLIRCLTPPVGISSGSSVQVKLQLGDITGFAEGLLVGNSRINVIYSLFFLLGFVYFLIKRNTKLIFLFSSIFLFLFSITILVVQISPRYTFAIYPLFVTLSVYSAFCILGSLGEILENGINKLLPLRAIALFCVALLFIGNLEPGRLLAGYQDALARENPKLFDYIKDHLQPNDVVVANLPAAAAVSLGKLDYFLPSQGILSLDGFYLNQGQMIDRWAGGKVVNSVDQFSEVLNKSNRVWIQLDDNPQPQDPNQRELYDYVRTLGKSVFEPYGARLRLWQKADGMLPREANDGKDLGNY